VNTPSGVIHAPDDLIHGRMTGVRCLDLSRAEWPCHPLAQRSEQTIGVVVDTVPGCFLNPLILQVEAPKATKGNSS